MDTRFLETFYLNNVSNNGAPRRYTDFFAEHINSHIIGPIAETATTTHFWSLDYASERIDINVM